MCYRRAVFLVRGYFRARGDVRAVLCVARVGNAQVGKLTAKLSALLSRQEESSSARRRGGCSNKRPLFAARPARQRVWQPPASASRRHSRTWSRSHTLVPVSSSQ